MSQNHKPRKTHRTRWAADKPVWWNRLHELWTKAVDQPGYDKRQWADFEAELWRSTTHSPMQPFAYVCPVLCGCMWRNNGDGTMSLFGKRSQSCEICEPLSLDKLVPLYREPR